MLYIIEVDHPNCVDPLFLDQVKGYVKRWGTSKVIKLMRPTMLAEKFKDPNSEEVLELIEQLKEANCTNIKVIPWNGF